MVHCWNTEGGTPPNPPYGKDVGCGITVEAALWDGTHAELVTNEDQIGGPGAWRAEYWAAIDRLESLPQPRHEVVPALKNRPTTAVHVFTCDDNLGASRMLIFDRLLASVGITSWPDGLLIAMPDHHTVMFHVITDRQSLNLAFIPMADRLLPATKSPDFLCFAMLYGPPDASAPFDYASDPTGPLAFLEEGPFAQLRAALAPGVPLTGRESRALQYRIIQQGVGGKRIQANRGPDGTTIFTDVQPATGPARESAPGPQPAPATPAPAGPSFGKMAAAAAAGYMLGRRKGKGGLFSGESLGEREARQHEEDMSRRWGSTKGRQDRDHHQGW
jgi:hypothetical protein